MPTYSFKKIEQYTDREIEEAIGKAIEHCESANLDFWKIFNGFDAYLEKRRRRAEKAGAFTPPATSKGD